METLVHDNDVVLVDLAQEIAPTRTTALKKINIDKVVNRDFRVLEQPAFVLHSYPYKETSLIVEVFSRDHGRIALIAKGAKRPHSQLRSSLQTFQPLIIAWSGKSDMPVLTSAEWVGGMLPLEKAALLCGFYLNELLIKFLLRKEAHPKLFNNYVETLNKLAHQSNAAIVLRQFELSLLRESGLIGDLSYCSHTKSAVTSQLSYVVDPNTGIRPCTSFDTIPKVLGKTLLDIHIGDYSDPTTQIQSKILMRFLLANQLNGEQLKTRQILIDLQNL